MRRTCGRRQDSFRKRRVSSFGLINMQSVAEINSSREDKHLSWKSVPGEFCGRDYRPQRVLKELCFKVTVCLVYDISGRLQDNTSIHPSVSLTSQSVQVHGNWSRSQLMGERRVTPGTGQTEVDPPPSRLWMQQSLWQRKIR